MTESQNSIANKLLLLLLLLLLLISQSIKHVSVILEGGATFGPVVESYW